MESFQIYHRFEEKVATLEAAHPPAVLPHCGLACCTPCDGSSETPQTPAFLPRPLPVGRYSWGAYQDGTSLHVVMDTAEGPAIEDLIHREDAVDQLLIFEPEGLWYRTLQIGLDGTPRCSSGPGRHGPRSLPCREKDWSWEVNRVATASGCWRTHWQVHLKDLAPHMRDGRLRVSLSRTSIRTLEGVAWGAHGIWEPRFDECGTLTFLPSAAADLAPVLHDVVLHYDPKTATARLALKWSNGYRHDESLATKPGSGWHRQTWTHYSARINRILHEQGFSDSGTLGPFPVQHGWNEIHVASRGATHARVFLEVCSDTAIHSPDYHGKTTWGDISHWVHAGLSQVIERHPTPPPQYARWMGKMGSAVAAWCHHFGGEPTWVDWIRQLGDRTLGWQRPDGTFAGCHLEKTGLAEIPWKGGAYDSGPMGEFWVRCHEVTGERHFLTASERLVHAYAGYRTELNPNYAAFALFHLSAHWKATGDKDALRHIDYYLRWCVTRHLLPLGFHGGHNYYTVYSSIILRGMARCLAVLPESSPWSATLPRTVRRMTNQALSRLQPDGSFDARDRDHTGERLWLECLCEAALVLEGEDRRRVDQAAHFVVSQAVARGEQSGDSSDFFTCSPPNLARTPSVVDYLVGRKTPGR